jgi:hypothetical protein
MEASFGTIKLFAEPIDGAVKKALELGLLAAVGSMKLDIKFDLKNPRAVAYLDQYGAKLVTGLNETTRDDMRKLIAQAVEGGLSWTQLEQAISNQFSDYVKDVGRAYLIAMTEIGEAYSEGNLIVARELAAAGLTIEKSWSTAGAGCDKICAPNEAQGWIPVDERFQSGHDRPLGHPGCWCDMLTRVAEK